MKNKISSVFTVFAVTFAIISMLLFIGGIVAVIMYDNHDRTDNHYIIPGVTHVTEHKGDLIITNATGPHIFDTTEGYYIENNTAYVHTTKASPDGERLGDAAWASVFTCLFCILATMICFMISTMTDTSGPKRT